MYEPEIYFLKAEFGQGLAMPEKDKDYKLKLRIGAHEIESGKPKVKEGDYVRWSENPKIKEKEKKGESYTTTIMSNMTGVTKKKQEKVDPIKIELPRILHQDNLLCTDQLDVFVYLVDEDDREISFWQDEIVSFYDNKAPRRWI